MGSVQWVKTSLFSLIACLVLLLCSNAMHAIGNDTESGSKTAVRLSDNLELFTTTSASCKYFKEGFSGFSTKTWTSGNGRWYEDNDGKLNVGQITFGETAYYQTSFHPDGFFVIDTNVDVVSIADGGAFGIYPFTNGDVLFEVNDKTLTGVGAIIFSSGDAYLAGWDNIGEKWYYFAKFVTTPPVASIGVAYLNDKIALRINNQNTTFFSGSFGMGPSVIDAIKFMARGDNTHLRFDNICYDPIVATSMLSEQPETLPAYRFFNNYSGDRFLTIYEDEKNALIQYYSDWYTYEGIGFYAFPTALSGALPVYRFGSNTGGFFYTINEVEKNALIQYYSDWYTYQGIGFYAYQTPAPKPTPTLTPKPTPTTTPKPTPTTTPKPTPTTTPKPTPTTTPKPTPTVTPKPTLLYTVTAHFKADTYLTIEEYNITLYLYNDKKWEASVKQKTVISGGGSTIETHTYSGKYNFTASNTLVIWDVPSGSSAALEDLDILKSIFYMSFNSKKTAEYASWNNKGVVGFMKSPTNCIAIWGGLEAISDYNKHPTSACEASYK
jgi:hypothetical protein